MTAQNIVVKVKIAWWFRFLYLPTVSCLCYLMQSEPNEERLKYWLDKAVEVK